MNDNDNINDESMESTGISVTSPMLDSLRGTRRWVTLVSVLLMVFAGITLLGGVIVTAMTGPEPRDAVVLRLIMMAIYLLVGAAYVALSVYLWRYARAIKHLDSQVAQTHLEHALEHQRKFWRLAGVLATLVIGFTFFGMVSAVVVPMFAGR
ncbi:MAG: hypothetical protein ACK5UX_04220 [Burkholderiales bacterium]